MKVEEIVERLRELEEAVKGVEETVERLKQLGEVPVPLDIHVAPALEVSYNVAIDAPPEAKVLFKRFPTRIRRVTVRAAGTVTVRVEGDDGEVSELHLTRLDALFVAILLWDALRGRGIDFLADLARQLERRREELLLLLERMERFSALLKVALA
ncbi:MAG: hypothetical protein QW324_05280 [Thermofilaceae archaeon]